MENNLFSGGPDVSAAYDYRLYDRVWQRVTPGVDPYEGAPSAGADAPQAPAVPVQGAPAPAVPAAPDAPAAPAVPQTEVSPAQEGTLPGAEQNPCCMGTVAQESLEVLEGFIQEELAGCRCCQSLSCKVKNANAAKLLRRIAAEKRCAARDLCAAYFLITGSQYNPAITIEHRCWENLAQALRSCYHQEACNGFNYQRAADGTTDPCLQKQLARLGEQAYRRAEEVQALLGCLLC